MLGTNCYILLTVKCRAVLLLLSSQSDSNCCLLYSDQAGLGHCQKPEAVDRCSMSMVS